MRNQSPPSHVGAIEVIRSTSAAQPRAAESMTKPRRQYMSRLLRRADLCLELGCALVDKLQLRKMRVEDAHDLRNLGRFVSTNDAD